MGTRESVSERLLPPTELCFRVSGTRDLDWFHRSGKITLDVYTRALVRVEHTFTDFTDIYDWGCGCGRVLRWLLDAAPQARLYGSDIDVPAIDWLRQNYPELDVRPNNGLPPLPFRNIGFDLVLGYSVLTHLDEHYQDAWLAELHRVTRPGAVLLLTVSSNRMWQHTMETSDHHNLDQLRALRGKLDENGIMHWTGDDWEQYFPEFYHTTFHLPEYIYQHWSRWFEVVAIEPGSAEMPQDVVILRRGVDQAHSA